MEKKKQKVKLLKLSKDSQKKIWGGVKTTAYDCTNDSCFGAFDRVVTYHYKTTL